MSREWASNNEVRARPAPRDPVAGAYANSLLLMAPLLVFYVFMTGYAGSSEWYENANRTAPFYLVLVLLLLTYRLSRVCPETLWSPAFWLPLQSAAFFGFGPLVEVYGNEATKAALSEHVLAVTQEQLFRSNLLSTVGIGCLLGGFWLHTVVNRQVWRRSLRNTKATAVWIQPATLALAAILGGALLRYAVIKPAQWGVIDIVVPGGLTAMGAIVDVGFGVAAFSAARGHRTMWWVMLLLWPVHLVLSTLSMAKDEIIIAMLFPAIGAYIGHRRLWRLGASFAVMAAIFMAAQPYVHHGRAIIMDNTGTIDQASYGERIAILGAYSQSGHPAQGRGDGRQGWWTRLNYAGVQAYAMDAHDTGRRGTSLDNAWMYFVPRVIWPGKPIMTGPGLEFYRSVTGHERGASFLGLSIYGDLYWQFGWAGILLGCPIIGWGFAMTSWRSIAAMRARQFVFVPVVLIAMEAAILGPTKYLVNGIIGTIPIYVVFLIGITFFVRFMANGRRPGRADAERPVPVSRLHAG